MGRDLLGAEERLADGARGRRRTGAEAHRESVAVALDEMERYVQARLGGNRPAETTANWVAATFEHDSARPVAGYAAPQLHTHVVFFNLTHTASGEIRPLQPRELYRTQQYGTAVYRSELAIRLAGLGYEIERGASGQPEIRGYTPAYLEASSPRRHQIQAQLEQQQRHGAGAAQIAAHQTREAKLDRSHDEVQRAHREMAEAFGDQPAHVVREAQTRASRVEQPVPMITVEAAVTFAKERNLEREAVVDERAMLRDALTRSMGEVTVGDIQAEFEQRVEAGEFIGVAQPPGVPGRGFTTREMLDLERDTLQMMRAGQHTQSALSGVTATDLRHHHPHLNEDQRAAVAQILASRDQILALEGVAGAGKTTALAAVRDEAERGGYRVEGFAPTSRAAQKLSEAGIASTTLQRHVARPEEPHDGQQRLYVLDESSLASTKQMHDLPSSSRRRRPGAARRRCPSAPGGRRRTPVSAAPGGGHGDGPARGHRAPEGSGPEGGGGAVVARRGRRQRSRHSTRRVASTRLPTARNDSPRSPASICKQPDGTLVVSPDNQSRMEINQVIHRAMQRAGDVDHAEHRARVLVARQEITGRGPAMGRAIRPRRCRALYAKAARRSASMPESTRVWNV